MDKELIAPQKGELKADDVACLYDDVFSAEGIRLSKAPKRSRILELMKELNRDSKNNICKLSDGRVVPIIVERKYEKRAVYCYFNTVDAPKEEILRAFAYKNNISYVPVKPVPKKEGELIAQDVLHLFDDVKVGEKKVAGEDKRAAMIYFFQDLYKDTKRNICTLPDGVDIPIIVQRTGVNNRIAYCLNTSVYHDEVMKAFAQQTDCSYLNYKENDEVPENKRKGELTARDCAKIFHGVSPCYSSNVKKETKEHLVKWFKYIYENNELNCVCLPNGEKEPLVVRRLSGSQRFICLNTSNARVKPFVLKRIAEITDANFCFDNLDLSKDDKRQLISSIKYLALAESKSQKEEDKRYYREYANVSFKEAKIKTKCSNVVDWLCDLGKNKR